MNQNKIDEINLLISLGVPLYFKINYKKPKYVVFALKAIFRDLSTNFPNYFKSQINYDEINTGASITISRLARQLGVKPIIVINGIELELKADHHIDEYHIRKYLT